MWHPLLDMASIGDISIFDGSGRIPDNKLWTQQVFADGNMIDDGVQRKKTAFAEFDPVLSDSRQRRIQLSGNRDIVEADDADVFGNPEAVYSAFFQSAGGEQVIAAYYGGSAERKQIGNVVFCGCGNIVAVRHPFFINFQTVGVHAVNIGLTPLFRDHGMGGTVQQGNFPVAKRNEMFDGVVDALKAVGADIAHIWILADIVIKKRGRNGRIMKLRKPGVLQGKADEKGADISVFQHKGVIFFTGLKIWSDRHNGDAVMRRIRSLLKAEDDVVAKLFRCFVAHIFNENAKLLRFAGTHLFWGISHFNGGIQYGLAKLFADVAGAVQSFGDGADRNAEPVCDIFYRSHKSFPQFLYDHRFSRQIFLSESYHYIKNKSIFQERREMIGIITKKVLENPSKNAKNYAKNERTVDKIP